MGAYMRMKMAGSRLNPPRAFHQDKRDDYLALGCPIRTDGYHYLMFKVINNVYEVILISYGPPQIPLMKGPSVISISTNIDCPAFCDFRH